MDRLGTLIWLVVAVGFGVNLVTGQRSNGTVQLAHVITLGAFFVLLLLRIALAAVRWRQRRGALLVLFASLGLWAAGSAVLNASAQPDLTHFPAPGEWLFLASYLGMAGFLIIDGAHWRSTARDIWLEAVVVCGGTTCLAASLLLTPMASIVGEGGVAFLVAVLYPMIDIALALLVVGQVVLRVRRGIERSSVLCLGFVLFAIADLNFVTHLSKGTYGFNVLDGLLWALGFALITQGACWSRSEVLRALPRQAGPGLMVGGASIALAVLAVRPHAGLGIYLTAPAVLTLVAAG
ncbi:MAG TPA: hypothetical protein VFD94_06110, partial [Jatrophihabitans sp.]|nr:hypothetical protein [Jatrophihabitans sp.]